MTIKECTIAQSLNKAYLKQDISENEFNRFKNALSSFFNSINYSETEEFQKNTIAVFLRNAFYNDKNLINTSDRIDLAIYNGNAKDSQVSVLMEVKRTSNKSEMFSIAKPNVKSFHEIIAYYLEQSFYQKNKEIKHIIITNSDEWYIFDGTEFEKSFYKNIYLINKFTEHRGEIFGASTTQWFYNFLRDEIVPNNGEMKCTYFNISLFKDYLHQPEKEEELIELFKVFSPEHLLKKPFVNDSNTLDSQFYDELLHILGLEETKESGKKVLLRLPPGKRIEGSLIENTIHNLRQKNAIENIDNIQDFGKNEEEQYFSIGLELCITWLNRILFLKLLESQLIKFHNNFDYKFLSSTQVTEFDDLNELFFDVLALKLPDRAHSNKERFKNIPYLNSSLFDMTNLERKTIIISNLKDRHKIPLYNKTVLRGISGERQTQNLQLHKYLLDFLDAFNFSSDRKAVIQQVNKTIINSSVLGLIFEKLNGYKDGSYFTPSYITMYMCREAITKAVVNKFNTHYKWNCVSLEDLYNRLETSSEKLKEYNIVFNSIRLVDPAVGSGHFLVSALNEFIHIKSELGILIDESGKRLRDYKLYIENDELIIVDDEDKIFTYMSPDITAGANRDELQRVQKTIFHEKQTIIENCLFGVDINPKSVAISRLRLWIELLKSAYYKKNEDNHYELEVLPNIDINIKEGNSLISRFPVDDNSPISIADAMIIPLYKNAVQNYKNINSQKEKATLRKDIESFKSQLRGMIVSKSVKTIQLADLKETLNILINQTDLFQVHKSKMDEQEFTKKVDSLTEQIQKLEKEVEDIKTNPVYHNAFEWRFEFPEVLDPQGNFIGFDVVIGNPPYIDNREITEIQKNALLSYQTNYQSQRPNLYQYFIELSYKIAKNNGHITLINPNQFLSIDAGFGLRKFLVENVIIISIDDVSYLKVFDSASTYTVVWTFKKEKNGNYPIRVSKCNSVEDIGKSSLTVYKDDIIANGKYLIIANINQILIMKIEKNKIILGDIADIVWGTSQSGYGKLKIKKEDFKKLSKIDRTKYKPIYQTRDIKKYSIKWAGEYIPINIFSDNIKKKFSLKEKILIARMTLKLQASLDLSKSYVGKSSILTITDNNFTYNFILAIINSKLIDFWYKNYFENTHLSGGYIRYDIPYLKKIPIPKISKEEQQPFIDLVDIVLTKKEKNEDTTAEEKEIDKLVYELYELTEEEIKVVEGE